MEINMKANGKTVKKMAEEVLLILMEVNMKVNGKMVNGMGKALVL
jgi:hypothetical protein